MSYKKDLIEQFAKLVIKAGLRVFLAESNNLSFYRTHGFFTDHSGSNVVYFQTDLGSIVFSGCYHPQINTGTGWRMDDVNLSTDINVLKKQLTELLSLRAPYWAVGDQQMKYYTLSTYLEKNKHSNYVEYK